MKIVEANTFIKRLIGLSFKINIDYCMYFPNCNSIHTFFMKEPIDIVMTDKNYKILYIYKNFKPWKIILPKKNVKHTFEYPANKVKYKINEKVVF